MNWLNLAVVLIVIFAAISGAGEGLVLGLTSLFIIFCSVVVALTFLGTMSSVIQTFIIQNNWYANIISLWLLIALVFMILWQVKEKKLRQEKIVLYPGVDKAGGAVCGLLLGAVFSSLLTFTVFMIPLNEKQKDSFSFLDKPVLFRVDELVPRFYSCLASKEVELEKAKLFKFDQFMYEYSYLKRADYKPKRKVKNEKLKHD